MTTIYYTIENENNFNLHVENYKRVKNVVDNLKNKYPMISSNYCTNSFEQIINFLKTVYSLDYINQIFNLTFTKTLCNNCTYSNSIKKNKCTICFSKLDKSILKNYLPNDSDTLFSSLTPQQIINVSNILLTILNDSSKYIYALIRPPGHHSSFDNHSGFCIINNAYLLAKNLNKKVLILDWDLHHGDGTESLILKENNKSIYYASLHGFEKNFYPGTGTLNTNNILNIPLKRGTTDQEYIEEFNNKFIPFYNNIQVDVIIISNGLDGHQDDNMDFLKLTDKSYLYITNFLKQTGKQLIFLLEGGYNVEVITEISSKIIDTLNIKNIEKSKTNYFNL
jgi:acetoin utilization deacetylase AcuC-like enzyme